MHISTGHKLNWHFYATTFCIFLLKLFFPYHSNQKRPKTFILLVLCLGLNIQQGWGQVAYNTVDNFDRTDNNSLGALWTENEDDVSQFAISGNVLHATTAGVTGKEPTNATLDLTTINASFDLGQSKVGWSFHLDLNRTPTGWGLNTYGLGWVLTANETDLSSATVDGYALLWTKTNGELVLVRFTDGISGDDPGTKVVSTGLNWNTLGADGVNVRVEVTAGGIWTVYWEAGVALTTATDIDAGSATGTDNNLFADASQNIQDLSGHMILPPVRARKAILIILALVWKRVL